MDIVEILGLTPDILDGELVFSNNALQASKEERLGRVLLHSFIVNAYISGTYRGTPFQNVLREASISPFAETQLLKTAVLRTGLCEYVDYQNCLRIFKRIVGYIMISLEHRWKRYDILFDWFKDEILTPVSGLHETEVGMHVGI